MQQTCEPRKGIKIEGLHLILGPLHDAPRPFPTPVMVEGGCYNGTLPIEGSGDCKQALDEVDR